MEKLEARGLEDKLQLFSPGASERSGLNGMGELEKYLGAPSSGSDSREAKPKAKAGEPQKLCVRSDGKKKIHTTYPDGAEIVEEYDEKTDALLSRKARKATAMGGEGEWQFEVGQAPQRPFDPSADFLQASSSNPLFMRMDTPDHFQWRVRNLPYPIATYSVTIDDEKQHIVVRTSNKKYFKRIDVPDLVRLGLKLQDDLLTWKHQHSTLIISYTRPMEVVKETKKTLQLVDSTAVQL